jgi:hypothetical protein
MAYRLPTTTDEMYRLLAAMGVGLAKIRDRGEILSEADLIGSGTFVRLGKSAGILTAAHVLDQVRDDTIGLMTFQREDYRGQFKLDIERDDFVVADGWDGASGTDLGFLRINDPSRVNALEALGCAFYNLTLDRQIPLEEPREFCLSGIVAESRIVDDSGPTPVTGFQAMFGAVEDIRLGEAETFVAKLRHDKETPAPTSYGGVSGGPLWMTSVNGSARPFRFLIGVAFYQTDQDESGSRDIHCQSLWYAYQTLLPKVAEKFGL